MKRLVLLFAMAAAALDPSLASGQNANPAAQPVPSFSHANTMNDNCKGGVACEEHTGMFATPVRQNGKGERNLVTQDLKTYGPSINFGNLGGWTTTRVIAAPHVVFGTSGIDQYMSTSVIKNGTGDLAGLYFYVFGGGRAALSDEGVTGITVESGEINGYFHGTIASGGGRGATSLTLAKTQNAPHNWDYTCDGCMLLDISKGTLAGHLNGRSQPFPSTYLNTLPTTGVTISNSPGKLPLTRAWCIAMSDIPPTNTAGVGTSRTLQCKLGAVGNSTPAMATGIVTISGINYPEQAQVTSVEPPSGGMQTITLLARNPNGGRPVLFQGGVAGQSLSFDDNLAFSGFRTSYYALGSLDGVNLIYASQSGGSVGEMTLPREGAEAEQTNSGFHLYPSAEIVANTASPASPILEPNTVNWENGDVVENPRYQSVGGTGVKDFCNQYTPSDQRHASECMAVEVQGAGISGTYKPFRLVNYNPFSMYKDYGGPMDAPVGMSVAGPFDNLILMDDAPAEGGSVVWIGRTANRDGKPFNLFTLPSTGGSNAAQVTYDPPTLRVGFPQGLMTGGIATRLNCAATNCGPATAGSFAIPAGATNVRINSSAITADSQILVTPDASLDARLKLTCNKNPATAFAAFGILARTPGQGFTVGVASPANAPNCYSFTIIN